MIYAKTKNKRIVKMNSKYKIKEYYKLKENRISIIHKEIILQALEAYKSQAFKMGVKAIEDGEKTSERYWETMVETIEETLNWFATNIDSYPSMELEKEK